MTRCLTRTIAKAAAVALTGLLAVAALAQGAPPATRPAPVGAGQPRPGEEPPLNPAQIEKMKSVLARYKADKLTVDDAKALKRALRDAGLRHTRALDDALRAAGFSPERLEVLDPRPARPPDDGAGPPRDVPRKPQG